MNNQFDELARSVAQSLTRRRALKKFGLGLAGMAFACFGLATKAEAGPDEIPNWCDRSTNPCCCKNCNSWLPRSDPSYGTCATAICPTSDPKCYGKRWI